jgi:hypothetical protein
MWPKFLAFETVCNAHGASSQRRRRGSKRIKIAALARSHAICISYGVRSTMCLDLARFLGFFSLFVAPYLLLNSQTAPGSRLSLDVRPTQTSTVRRSPLNPNPECRFSITAFAPIPISDLLFQCDSIKESNCGVYTVPGTIPT